MSEKERKGSEKEGETEPKFPLHNHGGKKGKGEQRQRKTEPEIKAGRKIKLQKKNAETGSRVWGGDSHCMGP